jgi:DNA-binding beta-propeller fold protein YncE
MATTPTKLSVALVPFLLLACAAEHERKNGGGTVEPGFDRHGLYVANTDHGSIVRIDFREPSVKTYQTGREPTRLTRVEDRVYVTNRADRTVSIFQDDGKELIEAGVIETGAEPFGVVATLDRVYVSASMDGRVIEYDAGSLQEIRSWELAGEPRGIALHPSGNSLYVASTYGGKWTHIDLRSGRARELDLPAASGFNFNTGLEFSLSRRITGDPAVSPDGDMLAIPALYVDRDTVIPDDPADETGMPGTGYGGRFNPAVVIVELGGDGEPDVDTQAAFAANGFVSDPEFGFFRSASGYPTSISFTPDQELALVAIEGADAVLALDLTQLEQLRGGAGSDAAAPGFGRPGSVGLAFLPLVTIGTAGGPDGIAVLDDDTAYVHALFDHRAQKIDLTSVRRALNPGSDAPIGPGFSETLRAASGLVLGEEVLPRDVARGRRLFFATGNPLMSGDGSAVSCATCHFQGRTDGFTWSFERGLRQTPSLAGVVSRYEPVGWMGDRPTVAEDAMLTSQGLMGGQGMTHADSLDIAAFVDFTREIDNPLAGAADERIARGAEIFARPEVACINCHAGAAYTNNQIVSLFGIETVKVRPLNGIRATAPYLHDGSSPTLRDLLERVRDGSMGNTSSLTDEEMSDLELYLLSL